MATTHVGDGGGDNQRMVDERILADEQFARLLASEEGAGWVQQPPSPEDDIPRMNSRSVRDNMMVRVNVLQGVRHAQNLKLLSCFTICWNLPKIAAITVVLAMYWSVSACDRPLMYWALVEGIRLLITLALSLAVFCGERNPQSSLRQSLEFCYQRSRHVHFAWFLIGAYWVFSSSTCASEAVVMYHLCMAILIVDTIDFFKNCVALICLIPVALLCLPCVIRLISVLDDPEEGRGATADAIADLPCAVYEKGLFGEDDPQCVICRMEYEEGDETRVLPCNKNHHFHANCIDEWLKVRDNCPYCRSPVTGLGHQSEAADDAQTAAAIAAAAANGDQAVENPNIPDELIPAPQAEYDPELIAADSLALAIDSCDNSSFGRRPTGLVGGVGDSKKREYPAMIL